jgi:hypothetical protein
MPLPFGDFPGGPLMARFRLICGDLESHMDSQPLDQAIAFEEYRLQIAARWPDSDTKKDMVARIERSLQRLREERVRMRRTHSEPRGELQHSGHGRFV